MVITPPKHRTRSAMKIISLLMRYEAVCKLDDVLLTLLPREEIVLRLRFSRGYTLAKSGESLRIDRERVRQIEAKAIRKLRHPSNTKIFKK